MNALQYNQLLLVRDTTKSKSIKHVPVDCCVISEYNPRRTRDQERIAELAKRIERNGFEITRALWAYQQGDLYHVFAGGNRLEAVKRTSILEVPIVLHEGYAPDDFVGLADQDNENDEYHAPVPIVDVWMEYRRLADMEWTVRRIAEAKDVAVGKVSERISYAKWPAKVQAVFTSGAANESHAREIAKLSQREHSAWMDWQTAVLEIIEAALKKGGTAKHFADLVAHYNDLTKTAEAHTKQLPAAYHDFYLAELQRIKARSQAALHQAYSKMVARVAADQEREALARQKELDEAKHREMLAVRERTKAEARQRFLHKLACGDARHVTLPHGIKLLFTDPPYGMGFQSNRRVVSAKADHIEGDQDGETALALLGNVLRRMMPHLTDDAFVLVWCDWRQQCATVSLLEEVGLTVREEVIWNKPNHSSGDLFGAPARKHEKFLFAAKGKPTLKGERFDTVLSGSAFAGSDHPTEKPVDLIATVIQSCTEPGDLVADPFMGSGGVPLTAYKEGRDFWGCDISNEWHSFASDQLLRLLGESHG